ncbi:MAG: CYTH domain-containing protein [Verrucomicrobiales bacterium]
MAQEIERKFLVISDAWRGHAAGVFYRQGYLSAGLGPTVRVRIAGSIAFLTIKGPTIGISRLEFEYPVPLADAEQLLALCVGPLIEKNRFEILHAGRIWQVDEFLGDNAGLIVAEVELASATDEIDLPDWVGKEVSHDARYSNANLASNPFSQWKQPE